MTSEFSLSTILRSGVISDSPFFSDRTRPNCFFTPKPVKIPSFQSLLDSLEVPRRRSVNERLEYYQSPSLVKYGPFPDSLLTFTPGNRSQVTEMIHSRPVENEERLVYEQGTPFGGYSYLPRISMSPLTRHAQIKKEVPVEKPVVVEAQKGIKKEERKPLKKRAFKKQPSNKKQPLNKKRKRVEDETYQPEEEEEKSEYREVKRRKTKKKKKKENLVVRKRGRSALGRSFFLPDRATTLLEGWFLKNVSKPYPSKDEKAVLARKTGLSSEQVSNWFSNIRKRKWLIIKKYLESRPRRNKEAVAMIKKSDFGREMYDGMEESGEFFRE